MKLTAWSEGCRARRNITNRKEREKRWNPFKAYLHLCFMLKIFLILLSSRICLWGQLDYTVKTTEAGRPADWRCGDVDIGLPRDVGECTLGQMRCHSERTPFPLEEIDCKTIPRAKGWKLNSAKSGRVHALRVSSLSWYKRPMPAFEKAKPAYIRDVL